MIENGATREVALLVKQNKNDIYNYKNYGKYIDADLTTIVVYHPTTGNLKKADLVESATGYLERIDTLGIAVVVVSDAKYFEYLTKAKLERSIGQLLECAVPEYEHLKILPLLSAGLVQMQPHKQELQDTAFQTINAYLQGSFQGPKEFEFTKYVAVTELDEARHQLERLKDIKVLTCDIETTGLMLGPETQILSIAFSPSLHKALSIHINKREDMLDLLRTFFIEYDGQLIFHNALYDVKHLIYNCFMDNIEDRQGMREGIAAFSNVDDTFMLAYLELNSTVRPVLGLKDLSFEFMGDYAEDVKNAESLPVDTLLEYNGKDVCATWFVYEKYKHQIRSQTYQQIARPSIAYMLELMLVGLPLDMARTLSVEEELLTTQNHALNVVGRNEYVALTVEKMKNLAAQKYNSTHKVARRRPSDFDLKFNPNSAAQVRILLFDVLGLEVLEVTPKGAPKVGREFIKTYYEEADDEAAKGVLKALIQLSEVTIVISTFLAAFKNDSLEHNGEHTLHGSHIFGGTQSGRLSARNPNLANLPSHSAYGKAIKSCVKAPKGWLFGGADFNALNFGGLAA